jgi:DNA-binding XRE family transcriptional regulator
MGKHPRGYYPITYFLSIEKRAKISKLLTEMAKNIKRRRLELGLYQRQVADIIGVREGTIPNWEHGVEPELIHMPAIIRFFGYNPLPTPPVDDPLEQLRHFKISNGMDFIRLGEAMSKNHEQLADWLGVPAI